MGMFDTVETHCSCGHVMEIQSKAGECSLQTYNISRVPDEIAQSLQDKKIQCFTCGKMYIIDFGIDKSIVYFAGTLKEHNDL